MSEHIKVSVFMPCFNESEIIRDTIKHYRTNFPNCSITFYDNFSTDNSEEIALSLDCKVIKWNTGNKIDDTKLRDLKNNCWKSAKDGWIIMADMDEWICIDEAQLINEDKKGVTILSTKGFNMHGDSKSITLDDINIQSVNKGFYNISYSKHICFNRTKISEINYEHGAHKCYPIGNIKYSKREYVIKHMVFLGLPFLIEKMKMKHKRSHDMRQVGLATHYTNDINTITQRYESHKKACININVPIMYMIYDTMRKPQKQLKFIHITKTAGTSIEDEGTNEKNKGRPEVLWGRNHEEYGWWHEMFPRKSKDMKNRYDWFMVVRNPYTRIISEMHYIFEKITDIEEFNSQLTKCLKYLVSNKDNFNHPYQRAQGDHFTEQHKYLDNSSVIHVLYFENIKEEFECLVGIYGFNNMKLEKVKYKSKNKFNIKDISKDNIELINNIYKKDFDTFGYTLLDYDTIQENNKCFTSSKRYIHNKNVIYDDNEDKGDHIDNYLYKDETVNKNIICPDNSRKKYAIVFLTNIPSEYLIKVSESLKNMSYTIFICVDDNDYKSKETNINIIQYSNDECVNNGYKNSNYLIKLNGTTSWDKALYHFCTKDTSFDYVWFIEENTFIPDYNLINIIDNKYLLEDILSKSDIINDNGELNWHWKQAHNKLPLPWMKSLVYAIRLSKSVLSLVDRYVKKNNQLLFIEFLFHTLALHKNLNIKSIHELRGIEYNKKWSTSEFEPDSLYHPVKREININTNLRELKYIPISRIANKYMCDLSKELKTAWGETHTEYGWRFEKFINKPTELKNKYDWLMIVRNPYTRILSEYMFFNTTMKLNNTVKDFNKFIKKWVTNIEKNIEGDPKFGRKIGDHFTEQYKYYDETAKIHIVKYENLQEELIPVLSKYNYSTDISTFEIETQFPYQRDDINDENINLINHVYDKDFELFGYEKINVDIVVQKQLKFIHITRTGGTSIEQDGLDKNIFWGRYDRSYGIFDEPFNIKSEALKRNYEWFTVVRNPYTRVISEYNYLKIVLKIKNPDDPKVFNSYIEKWLLMLKNNPKPQIHGYHLIPQCKYIDANHKITILKFENLTHEFNELMDKYEYPVKLTKLVSISNKVVTVTHLSENNIKLIKEIYKEDFEMFGYCINLYI
jgi:hypothetical protein